MNESQQTEAWPVGKGADGPCPMGQRAGVLREEDTFDSAGGHWLPVFRAARCSGAQAFRARRW